jgi:hypothetical protein
MQILCYHLAFFQNPPPFRCSLTPPSPQQVLYVSHREFQKSVAVHAVAGVLGMKALLNQLDEIL